MDLPICFKVSITLFYFKYIEIYINILISLEIIYLINYKEVDTY